ncbi:dihydrodipicolinate synthase family protein [Pedobacter rhizosphaerae]|uniref:N-acetylneuraminate lyase n=1 Tax=Pedobacter rhizosphaerae TaxID=390241 RepID=A0A1H9URP5_9SPHI|nr:dihydrodipicolinate synthase family protein [Pedobacter rhizosphaerae]SES12210.1 N-acetylneuraminate lyase [Pedobacter rhizosphaerae]
MSYTHLQGLIAAPFTPFHPSGELNLALIPSYYELLKQNGVTGAFICGSTGEGVSLTSKEKMQVAEAWANATNADPNFKVMTLLGGTCIAECKLLAKHAEQIGLYGVSFTAPSYFKPANATVLAEICAEIAAEVPDMPFYYYHIPVLTGANIPMYDLLMAIDGQIPNFAGIKYTHEDFMDFLSCMNLEQGRYDMLWGRDENMLSALVLGAKAAVGSTFNYLAPLYHKLIAAFEERDFVSAAQYQQRAIDFIRLLGKYGGIATGKAYMKLLGLTCGEFRLPVKNMTNEQFNSFEADVMSLGFTEFRSLPVAASKVNEGN